MTTAPVDARQWAAMNGAGFPRLALPPADLLPAPVAKAASCYVDLLATWQAAAAELRALDAKPARHAAEAEDTAAYAAAIAAGKPDPGEKSLRAYEDKLRSAARRKAAAAKAVGDAARDLLDAVAKHRDAIDTAARQRTAKAEAAYLAAVDALPGAALELAQARRLAAWPDDLERRQPWGRPLPVPNVATIDGNITAESVAAALRAVVTPPVPPDPGPLHITADVTGKALAEAGPVPDDEAA